jgi:DNA-binding transcriptional MerR regulator
MGKSADAFRTISEVADWLEVPAHVLRFWESKFTQVKPVKRAGGRRYYRRADMHLLGGIKVLLHDEGMTIKGVQKMLREQGVSHVAALSPGFEGEEAAAPPPAPGAQVLSFARPDEAPEAPQPAPDTTPAQAAPEAADPSPAPATAPEPSVTPPDTSLSSPAPSSAPADDDAGQALPPLPDLGDDPPDTMPADPGPLARLAALPRPLPAPLAARLAALAERLRDAGASKA